MPSVLWGASAGADVCVPFSGYSSLSGCRLLNAGAEDDLELDWSTHTPTANDIVVARMEDNWQDVSGAGNHGVPSGSPTFATDALSRCGVIGATVNDYVTFPVSGGAWTSYTVEAWAKFHSGIPSGRFLFGLGSPQFRVRTTVEPGIQVTIFNASATISVTRGVWHYCTFQGTRSGTNSAYIDGVRVAQWAAGASGALGGVPLGLAGSSGNMSVDELRVNTGVVRSGESYTCPVWRKSAAQNSGVQPYGQVGITGLAGMLPTAISWTAQTGSAYGRIHSVWVNDVTGGWTQVGGAYPTSPISIAGLTLASNDAVRVALEPEAVSGIQNASPTLYTVRLDYAVPVTGYGRPRISRITSGRLIG